MCTVQQQIEKWHSTVSPSLQLIAKLQQVSLDHCVLHMHVCLTREAISSSPMPTDAISMPTRYPACYRNANKIPCMLSPCQGTQRDVTMPIRDPECHLHADQMLFLPSSFQQETLHVISMPRYNACHRNASKRPCHLHAALSAILRLTGNPACHFHANNRPCELYSSC